MKSFPELIDLNTGTKKSEWYIQKHYPDFYQYLIDNFDFCNSHIERLYCYYNNINSTPICPVCNTTLQFNKVLRKYPIYCSCKCSNKDNAKISKSKQTCLEKYGVENVSNIKEVRDKAQQTMLKRYGEKNFTNREKSKQTCLEKYGVENYSSTQEYKEKVQKTNLKKYGNKWAVSSNIVREKSKETNIQKYGNEYYNNREKSKETNLERYGVEYYTNYEKMKNTCLERYGVDNPFKIESVHEKIKQICLERYGVDNPFKVENFWEEHKEQITKTIQEKYGVDWYCQLVDSKKYKKVSKTNIKFAEFLTLHNIKYETEFNISNRSYDFKVDDVLIEINPYPTHNSTWSPFDNPKSKTYHFDKTQLAKENNFRCIHIWDWDDWDKVINILKKDEVIYARNCEIKEVSKKECNEFLNTYHFQNTCNGQTIRLGLYYNNELVEIMTFGKPRYNKKYEYELLRLCSRKQIAGGSEKLFKYFINTYNPSSIISYCDNSKFNGNVYERLNFTLKSQSISKHWYDGKTHITDNLLRQRGFDQLFKTNYGKGTSNEELMIEHEFVELYDSGQSTWVYNKKEELF